MKPVKVEMIDEAAEEFERLNKVVGEELKKGVKNSKHQQVAKLRYFALSCR